MKEQVQSSPMSGEDGYSGVCVRACVVDGECGHGIGQAQWLREYPGEALAVERTCNSVAFSLSLSHTYQHKQLTVFSGAPLLFYPSLSPSRSLFLLLRHSP